MNPNELTRPALPKLAVGQQFTVVEPGNRWHPARTYDATVIKVGRKYVTLESPERLWEMEIGSQRRKMEGGYGSISRPYFATAEQLAWDVRLREARDYLTVQGIQISGYGDFKARGDAGVIALAALIEKYFPR